MSVEIHGTVSEGWEPIHEKLVSNFHSLGELGASICITFEGETVVDLWAGESDTLGNPWNEDTIAVVNSCTKGAVALACHLLADRGLLDQPHDVESHHRRRCFSGGVTARSCV